MIVHLGCHQINYNYKFTKNNYNFTFGKQIHFSKIYVYYGIYREFSYTDFLSDPNVIYS